MHANKTSKSISSLDKTLLKNEVSQTEKKCEILGLIRQNLILWTVKSKT